MKNAQFHRMIFPRLFFIEALEMIFFLVLFNKGMNLCSKRLKMICSDAIDNDLEQRNTHMMHTKF